MARILFEIHLKDRNLSYGHRIFSNLLLVKKDVRFSFGLQARNQEISPRIYSHVFLAKIEFFSDSDNGQEISLKTIARTERRSSTRGQGTFLKSPLVKKLTFVSNNNPKNFVLKCVECLK